MGEDPKAGKSSCSIYIKANHMSPVIVMVAFYSTRGSTERLSTAVAVGAVQGRAGIRLRRMPDRAPQARVHERSEVKESLERMRKEYVTPTESDVIAADALVFGVPEDFALESGEWKAYLDLLARLGSEGKLLGKVGLALGSEPGLSAFSHAIAPLGLATPGPGSALREEVPVDDVEHAIALGRRVVEAARALRESTV